jgi:hypothetical protein
MPETKEEPVFREGNISLILDGYDDIFSDFDPRPFEHRALSDDFLLECRKAARDKDEFDLELRLLAPKEKRSLESEVKIKHRLHEHFTKHHREQEAALRRHRQKGALMVAFGIACFAMTVYISTRALSPVALQTLTFLFEPAGWFLMWEGLYQLFFGVKEKENDYQFYRKMAGLHITFYGY